MANILGNANLNNLDIIEVDGDPSVGLGTPSEVGNIAIVNIAGFPFYQKFGLADTDWRPVAVRSFAHYTNQQTNQNLNNTFTVAVEIFENEEEISDDFTLLSNEEIRCNFDGFIRASFHVHLFSNGSRENLRVQFYKNFSQPIGPIGASGYIRDSNGHQESSIDGYTIIPVVNGDTIALGSTREANSGTVTLAQSETSNIILERF